ncbi:MAG: ABC transporter ATP-binding protein [Lachnospiraceae bacterium]|nr:ABC transporter ATP-binding protein [Candidatus Darwinimomas equi]
MDNNLAIKVNNVTKTYKLYEKPIDRLKESLSRRQYHRPFNALNDVSFEVEKGTTVGIIGTNGSGKSTMLKIITGVLSQTTGTVETEGNISALLELGAGFNMDYTGIENIYMNGTMMGFTRAQMDEKLDDILEFAEIGDFVYQPVKTYSSGMFVRLAFALAINVDPDILIVDEALSVGDVFFQSKCYKRMEEIRKNGTTILMVTHDMGSIIKYCDKVVVLNRGDKIAEGPAGEMVDLYKKILAGKYGNEDEKKEDEMISSQITVNPNRTEYGDGRARIIDFGLFDEKGEATNLLLKGEYFTIREKIRFHEDIAAPIFTYTIKDRKGTELTGTNTMFESADVSPAKPGDVYEVEFRQKMTLQGGDYLLSMSCTSFEGGVHTVYHRLYDVASITVISNKNTVGVYDMESEVSVVKHEA